MNTGLVQRIANNFNDMDGSNILKVIRMTSQQKEIIDAAIEKNKSEIDAIIEKYNSTNNVIVTGTQLRSEIDGLKAELNRPVIGETTEKDKTEQETEPLDRPIEDDEIER